MLAWIRIENNPKPGESELNVYHYVVKQPDNDGMCDVFGPYNSGAHLPHLTGLEEIGKIKLGSESIDKNLDKDELGD